MVEVIKQYGEMVMAMAGTLGFLIIIGNFFLSDNGLLIRMILLWLNGGG